MGKGSQAAICHSDIEGLCGMFSGCCFCFSNVNFPEPRCPTRIHTTPRDAHLMQAGLGGTGLALLVCALTNMIWNARGDLSRQLNSAPFSWPSP